MPFINSTDAYDASGNLMKNVKIIVNKKGKTRYIKTKSDEEVKKKNKKVSSGILIERGVFLLFGD